MNAGSSVCGDKTTPAVVAAAAAAAATQASPARAAAAGGPKKTPSAELQQTNQNAEQTTSKNMEQKSRGRGTERGRAKEGEEIRTEPTNGGSTSINTRTRSPPCAMEFLFKHILENVTPDEIAITCDDGSEIRFTKE